MSGPRRKVQLWPIIQGGRETSKLATTYIEGNFVRLGWQLHQDDRNLDRPDSRIRNPRMVPAELLQDHCLTHTRPTMDQKARHAVALRVGEKITHARQCHFSIRVVDPALRADPLNAICIGQVCGRPVLTQQVFIFRHDHSSTANGVIRLASFSKAAAGVSVGPGTTSASSSPRRIRSRLRRATLLLAAARSTRSRCRSSASKTWFCVRRLLPASNSCRRTALISDSVTAGKRRSLYGIGQYVPSGSRR